MKQKFEKFELPHEAGALYPSCYSAAAYIRDFHPDVKRVYVIGQAGVVDELRLAGIEAEGAEEDSAKSADPSVLQTFAEGEPVQAVVVGWDF